MATLVVAYKSYGMKSEELNNLNTTSKKTNLFVAGKNNAAAGALTPKALFLSIFFFKCVLQGYVVLLSF